jgi:hypothetical protein
MQLDGYVQLVRDDLSRIAAVGDEATARAAELLSVALESSLARRLQEALAEAALELSDQLDEGAVEVRVAGGDPELVFIGSPPATDAGPGDEALDARITLRLPERLKTRLDDAAAASGVSVNTWLVQTLHRCLDSRPAATGQRRLTGFGRA